MHAKKYSVYFHKRLPCNKNKERILSDFFVEFIQNKLIQHCALSNPYFILACWSSTTGRVVNFPTIHSLSLPAGLQLLEEWLTLLLFILHPCLLVFNCWKRGYSLVHLHAATFVPTYYIIESYQTFFIFNTVLMLINGNLTDFYL